jgi:hypothetical protein
MARTVVAAVAIGTVAVALAGVAHATGTTSDQVITACYQARTGALRVIDANAGKGCKRNERPLDWNRQGVPGSSGYQIVKAEGGSNEPGVAVGSHPGTTLDEQGTQYATAYCPSGKKVTGGGVDVSFAPGITVNASYPQNPWGQTGPSEQDGGWSGYATIDASLQGSRRWTIKVWAFCAAVTP